MRTYIKAGGQVMLPYNTTDRLNMAVYSRLFLSAYLISQALIMKGASYCMYAEFLTLLVLLLIIKKLEKISK